MSRIIDDLCTLVQYLFRTRCRPYNLSCGVGTVVADWDREEIMVWSHVLKRAGHHCGKPHGGGYELGQHDESMRPRPISSRPGSSVGTSVRAYSMLCTVIIFAALVGCQEIGKVSPNASWHQRCGWKAEDYFTDPQVIRLCNAIEANDIKEIERLVADGADVKTKGKSNMTPLLWAFPDNKLDRFRLLLEYGADPNVVIESDFNSRGAMRAGDSVTHMACGTSFPGYFEAVFDHGGDPNSIKNGIISNETPLFTLISGRASKKVEKTKVLIAKGADIDHIDGTAQTPASFAVGLGAQYEVALVLLQAGANHRIYGPMDNCKLIHHVVEAESRLAALPPDKRTEYKTLLKWLVDHGESIDDARADMKRWQSWSITTGEYQRKMAEEVSLRIAREAQEKEKSDKEAQKNK